MLNTFQGASQDSGLILSDGMLLVIGFNKTDCSFDMVPHNGNYTRCGFINVDVNGFKGPNQIGKDIVNFNVLKDRLIPEGSLSVDESKVCNAASLGWDCAFKYLY